MPDLFQITRENWASCVGSYDNIKELAISMFETKCALKLYADKNMHYTPESLYHHFSTQTINHYSDNSKPNNPMPVKFHQESGYISFGQFSYDGKEQNPPRDSRTYLLFSKRLKDCLDISLEDDSQCSNEFKERKDLVDLVDLYCDDSGEYVFTPDWDEYTIDGETYYRLYNARLYKKRRFYPFTSKKKNFHTANPTLLRIISPNIEYAVCGGSYDQCLRELTSNDFGKYTNLEFENLEFFDAAATTINSFEVRIVDQNNNPLILRAGETT